MAQQIVITAVGEYPYPDAFKAAPASASPAQALAAEIEAHMKAYGLQSVKVNIDSIDPCPTCQGTGSVRLSTDPANATLWPCPNCHGSKAQ